MGVEGGYGLVDAVDFGAPDPPHGPRWAGAEGDEGQGGAGAVGQEDTAVDRALFPLGYLGRQGGESEVEPEIEHRAPGHVGQDAPVHRPWAVHVPVFPGRHQPGGAADVLAHLLTGVHDALGELRPGHLELALAHST
ncbi:hypothetical protein ACPEIC_37895 [Stenotrophomonas sp. NPDC087984]